MTALLKVYPFGVGGITKKLNTPLHEACKYGAPIPIIELLIDRFPGALHERNAKGELPIDRARVHGKTKVVRLLEKAMALSVPLDEQSDESSIAPDETEDDVACH